LGIFRKCSLDTASAYEKYSDMLYRLALSYMQSDSDAQDAVHDVFMKFAVNSEDFKNETHLRSWLVRVTVNQCLDALRKRKTRQYVQLDELSDSLPSSDNHSSDDSAFVLNALQLVPEKNRAVIVLHCLEGYSVEETAGLLEISVSAVKMRLSRGRDCLRQILDKE